MSRRERHVLNMSLYVAASISFIQSVLIFLVLIYQTHRQQLRLPVPPNAIFFPGAMLMRHKIKTLNSKYGKLYLSASRKSMRNPVNTSGVQ